jgi:hypothetical protein
MVKIIRLFAFLNIMLCSKLFGQNLILNHSFEDFSSTAWKPVLTVDYLNPGPNQEGNITVTDGTTCLGLRFWSPIADDWQEYIAQIVAGKFVAGKTYGGF